MPLEQELTVAEVFFWMGHITALIENSDDPQEHKDLQKRAIFAALDALDEKSKREQL